MNATIKNPPFNEIDAAFKNLNITSQEKIKMNQLHLINSLSSNQKC